MPTVSVIIPTYNRADALPRTLDSALEQTLDDIEVIVVDDASTDHTDVVLDGFDDPRLTVHTHVRNRGGSAARNTGIEHATGKYVAFLDSDDVWHPTKLEKQVETLENRSEEWVAAYCGVRVESEGGSRLRDAIAERITRRNETEGAEGGVELVGDVLADDLHTSAGSTLMVRRDIAEAIDGFDESFDRFQDPEFLIRVLREGKLSYVDEPLLTRFDTGHPPADAVAEADEHYLDTFADTIAALEADGRDIVGAHHLLLARLYFAEGKFRKGLGYLRTARVPTLRQYPGLAHTVVTGARHRLG